MRYSALGLATLGGYLLFSARRSVRRQTAAELAQEEPEPEAQGLRMPAPALLITRDPLEVLAPARMPLGTED